MQRFPNVDRILAKTQSDVLRYVQEHAKFHADFKSPDDIDLNYSWVELPAVSPEQFELLPAEFSVSVSDTFYDERGDRGTRFTVKYDVWVTGYDAQKQEILFDAIPDENYERD